MTQNNTITNYTPITSPSNEGLKLTLFAGKEGISDHGFRIFEGVVTGAELAEHFPIEASSDHYPDYLKRQRNLGASRAKKLINYFETRTDTTLPGIVIFVSHITEEYRFVVGNREMITCVLPIETDRLTADGQNRTNLYLCSKLMDERPELLTHTINVKFIVADQPSLECVDLAIKQVFSDFHQNLVKPKSAQNLYFDNSQPYSRVLRGLINSSMVEIGLNRHFREYISTTGSATPRQFLLLNQTLAMVNIVLDKTALTINKELVKSGEEKELFFLEKIKPYMLSFYDNCPLSVLEDNDFNSDNAMFTKAIYAKAYSWLMRSLIEECIDYDVPVDLTRLNKVTDLPLLDMTDSFWVKAGVVNEVKNDSKIVEKYLMIKSSEKILARRLCRVCKIQPSELL